ARVCVDAAREPEAAALGDLKAVRRLGSRAVLATPIVVFDELIGTLALHRGDTRPWTSDAIALTEAVGREVGFALHVARLLDENRRRLDRQSEPLHAAPELEQRHA